MEKNKKNSGFTLIEVLISLFILMLIAIPALNSFMTVQRANRKAESMQNAEELANSAMELIKGFGYTDTCSYILDVKNGKEDPALFLFGEFEDYDNLYSLQLAENLMGITAKGIVSGSDVYDLELRFDSEVYSDLSTSEEDIPAFNTYKYPVLDGLYSRGAAAIYTSDIDSSINDRAVSDFYSSIKEEDYESAWEALGKNKEDFDKTKAKNLFLTHLRKNIDRTVEIKITYDEESELYDLVCNVRFEYPAEKLAVFLADTEIAYEDIFVAWNGARDTITGIYLFQDMMDDDFDGKDRLWIDYDNENIPDGKRLKNVSVYLIGSKVDGYEYNKPKNVEVKFDSKLMANIYLHTRDEYVIQGNVNIVKDSDGNNILYNNETAKDRIYEVTVIVRDSSGNEVAGIVSACLE